MPGSARKVYIDRRAAMEHRSDPSTDPDCRNAVFCQLFESLRPRDGGQKPLDYRSVHVELYSLTMPTCMMNSLAIVSSFSPIFLQCLSAVFCQLF